MTDTMPVPGWTHPVREAELPGIAEGLARLLEKVQNWAPYVDGLLLDDVAAVLDDHVPDEYEVAEHAQRLRSHLMRLVNLAVASRVDQRDRGWLTSSSEAGNSGPRNCPVTIRRL